MTGYGNDRCTSLYWAAKEGYTDIVDLLLKKGADPNATSTV
jgi:ankyrin repeat protein